MFKLKQPVRRWSSLLLARGLSTVGAWKLPEIHQISIGLRTLIITADDNQSQEYAKRMWFENQKIGIEASFYTVKTALSTPFSVQEGLEIVRRTGAKVSPPAMMLNQNKTLYKKQLYLRRSQIALSALFYGVFSNIIAASITIENAIESLATQLSIITIGSSSICDIGKGIQNLMENGLKTVDELDRQVALVTAEKDTSRIQNNNSSGIANLHNFKGKSVNLTVFPHYTIPTDICPLYGKNTWSALHKEDDVLIRRNCRAPGAVAFDSEILEASKGFQSKAVQSYLLSHIFDTFFLHFLSLHDGDNNDKKYREENKEGRDFVSLERIAELLLEVRNRSDVSTGLRRTLSVLSPAAEGGLEGGNRDESTCDLSAAAAAIVELQSLLQHLRNSTSSNPTQIESTSTISGSNPPALSQIAQDPTNKNIRNKSLLDSSRFGVLETVSLVFLLRSYQKGLPLPMSWVHSFSLKACLDIVLEERKRDSGSSKLSAAEYPIVASALCASSALCGLLHITEDQLAAFSRENVTSLLNSKIYVEKIKSKKEKTGSKGQKIPENGGDDGMGPGGLIEGWVVSEEMNLETLNKKTSESSVLKMLKSDFLLDLTGNVFKYQK